MTQSFTRDRSTPRIEAAFQARQIQVNASLSTSTKVLRTIDLYIALRSQRGNIAVE